MLGGHRGRDRMVVGFTTYEISSYMQDIIVSCEIVSGCVIFVKNLTQTERSHCCALFRPLILS